MNGDRLVLDFGGPNRSVRMRVVIADAKKQDARQDRMLAAPMPPARPITLTEEIRQRRLRQRTETVDAAVYECIADFLWTQYDVESIDVDAMEKELRTYFQATAHASSGSSV